MIEIITGESGERQEQEMEKLMQRLFSKRTLYILCFVALNLIEFIRNSQRGDVWAVAVNCTGLVMMVIVASAWPLRDFLTVGNGIYTVLCALAMILAGVCKDTALGQFTIWQVETAILNVWWIGIMVKDYFTRVVIKKTIAFKPGLMGWLWIAMSILMIFSVSQRLWPLWFLFMFGIFYLTPYKEEDRKALWEAMVDGTIIGFFCIQIYAYGFRPYDELRYKGAYSNSNMTALYYLIVYLMCLLKLHLLEAKKAHKAWKLFYLIGAGGMISFQMFTGGRTALVVSFVITVLYGILVIRKVWDKKWGQVLYRGCALGLALALTFLPVFYTIRWLPTILHHPIWNEGEYSIKKVHSFDPADSEKYTELDEFLELFFWRITTGIYKISSLNPFLLRVQAAEADDYELVELVDIPGLGGGLRDRLTIYKVYIRDMTLFGHGPGDGFYYIGSKRFRSWHAHNLWIQIGYYYGIPSGILLCILTFVMLARYRRKMNLYVEPYAIYSFFMCVMVFLFGTMEMVWNPGQLVVFLLFFVQHPQMGIEGQSD